MAILEIKDTNMIRRLDNELRDSLVKIGKYNPKTGIITIDKTDFSLRTWKVTTRKLRLFRKTDKNFVMDPSGELLQAELFPADPEFEFRDQSYHVSNRKTMRLERDVDLNKLPKAKFVLPDSGGIASRKLDEVDVKSKLFEMFDNAPSLNFDEIKNHIDQPRNYLQKILDQICDKKKVQNKFVYTLKSTYEHRENFGDSKRVKTH